VALLAIGIGANTLIFTAVDALLLRPLPVKNPQQLVRFVLIHPTGFVEFWMGRNNAWIMRDRFKSCSEVFAEGQVDMSFRSGDRLETVSAEFVTDNYYRALGIQPLLGRLTAGSDDNAVVLSYGFWQRAFGGRNGVLGESIHLRGQPFTIVGVLPRGFAGMQIEDSPDVRLPLKKDSQVSLQIYGRLRDGVTLEQARAEYVSVYPAIAEAELALSPKMTPEERHASLVAAQEVHPQLEIVANGISTLRKQFSTAVQLLMGAVGVLLLSVCANVAGLMLARMEARRKEIAVRLSLGARPQRILRDTLGESLILSVLGAVGGFLIASSCGPLLLRMMPARRPLALELTPDPRVLFFTIGVCFVTALLITLLPSLHIFRTDLAGLMSRGGPQARRSRVGHALVALQVALATLLLVSGFALARTVERLRLADPGFEREQLIVMSIDPGMAGVRMEESKAVWDQVIQRAESLPGVASVSLARSQVMHGIGVKTTVALAGRRTTPQDFLNSSLNDVSLGYFQTMGMRIVAGRDFQASDAANTKPRPSVVTASFVKRFLAPGDPIGQKFGTGRTSVVGPDYVVVGVVADTKIRSMREEAPPTFFSAMNDAALRDSDRLQLFVRARGGTAGVIRDVENMMATVGPGIAPSEVATMDQEIETSMWQERLIAALSSTFAGLSALLVAIGLYGLLAYSVSRRTREFGIRMALGARVRHITRLVGREVVWTIVPGLVAGLVAYAFCARIIGPLLYGLRTYDVTSLVGTALLLAAVGCIAGFGPARRAIAVEPTQALREE